MMNRITQDLQRITYTLSAGELCEAIRQYLSDQHHVFLPVEAAFDVSAHGAKVVTEYVQTPSAKAIEAGTGQTAGLEP